MYCYEKLGGVKWLLKFAEANPAEFIRQGLSRLWPAPAKDDPDAVYNTQINVNNLTEMEAARRVAYALAKAVDQQGDMTPVQTYQPPHWQADAVPDMPPLLQPEPPLDADREKWASEIGLSPEERRSRRLVEATQNCTLESYHGSPSEQGGTVRQSTATNRKPTVNELRRKQLL